jgi:hypothetical protein
MPQITAHINKKHKSLLDHDSDLYTSAEGDIQMEEGQDHEEEDDDHETVEFHNNNELGDLQRSPILALRYHCAVERDGLSVGRNCCNM